jgi:hypothetical protein
VVCLSFFGAFKQVVFYKMRHAVFIIPFITAARIDNQGQMADVALRGLKNYPEAISKTMHQMRHWAQK